MKTGLNAELTAGYEVPNSEPRMPPTNDDAENLYEVVRAGGGLDYSSGASVQSLYARRRLSVVLPLAENILSLVWGSHGKTRIASEGPRPAYSKGKAAYEETT